MKTPSEWIAHFELNATKKRINWEQAPQITDQQKASILYGLRAWQKGETSDGNHLRAAAGKYAKLINDPDYLKAIDLFIKEEQKHGANLGRYIDTIGEKRLTFDWGDYLFRTVRYFNTSMEVWTVTVLIVESAAQIFYQALKTATHCPLLKEICTDILIDEAYHITFQKERLAQIMQPKGFLNFHISLTLYFLFFKATTTAIWIAHHKAFKAGNINRKKFFQLMEHKIQKAFDIRYEKVLPKVALTS